VSADVITAVLLVAVPIAFNLAFFELGRVFDYPNILRKDPDEILRRFAAGGPGLLLRWQALLLSALAMLPLVALLAVVLAAPPALTALSIVVGSAAALVQALGLVRWPFAVPELARRYIAADGPDGAATRGSIEVVVATLHRLLGVGLGEHPWLPADGGMDAAGCRLDPVRRRPARLARSDRHPDRRRAADRDARVRWAE
jgi:hypothetical protein